MRHSQIAVRWRAAVAVAVAVAVNIGPTSNPPSKKSSDLHREYLTKYKALQALKQMGGK